MKNQELATIVSLPVNDVMTLAKTFAESGMFTDTKQTAQAFVKIMAGQEIGIPPFAAMSGVHIIQGKPTIGAGLIGDLETPMNKLEFLAFLKESFQLPVIRHTQLTGRPIQQVALCGGAGSFLISKALHAKTDIFISADIKYHEFFDADNRMVIADIGHFESERYTIDLLHDILLEKFPTFAVLKTAVNTNPVFYYA